MSRTSMNQAMAHMALVALPHAKVGKEGINERKQRDDKKRNLRGRNTKKWGKV